MKVSYDSQGDMLCLTLGDVSTRQTTKGFGPDILACYDLDGRLGSLFTFNVKSSLAPGERLNDFVMTLQTTTEAVGAEVPQESFDRIMARISQASAAVPGGGTPGRQTK